MRRNTREQSRRRARRVGPVAVVGAMLVGVVGVVAPTTTTSADDHRLFDLFDADAPSDDWQNTYLLSLLSMYVYNSELDTDDAGFEAAAQAQFDLVGLDDVRQVDGFANLALDVEALVTETDDAMIVTFRGTEFFGPNALDLLDLFVDGFFATDPFGAHLGFKTAALAVEQSIRDELDTAGDRKIWLTGHSLGGAMAQMIAYLVRDDQDYDIQGVVTFGEPQIFKVGIDSGLYIGSDLDPITELWVDSYDPVPHLAGIADNVANLAEFSAFPFLFSDNLVNIIFQYLHVGQRHHLQLDGSGGCTVDTEFPGGLDLINLDFTLGDHNLRRYATRILNLMPADKRLELVSIETPAGSLIENPPLPESPEDPPAVCDEAPNRPPTADAGGPYTVAEGDAVTLDGSGTDPNGDDLDFAWDLDGNGTFETAGPAPTFSAAGLDGPSSRTVWLEVTDPDGVTDVDQAVVNVTNAAPSVSAGLDRATTEGSALSLRTLAFSDPGVPDTHTASVDWGDGSSAQAGSVIEVGGSGVVSFPAHVYADNGSYTVTVCVTDDDGGQGCDTAGVTVSNVAPSVSAGSSQTVAEGSTISLASSFGDGGTLDTHTATVNWGDGTATEAASVTESPFGPPGSTAGMTGSVSGSHVYADNGSYTVTVCVTDDDGGQGCDTTGITVSNVAPVVEAGGSQTVAEGSTISLASTFGDAGTLDTHAATVNWGDDTSTESATVTESPFGPPGSTAGMTGSVSGSHVYADNGSYAVTVCVTDDEGATHCDSFTATVSNVAPTANIDKIGDGPDFFLPHVEVPLTGSFHDAGTLDTHTATVTWGDGSKTSATVTEAPFGPPGSTAGLDGTLADAHTWTSPAIYDMTLAVVDDDGESGATTVDIEVVDPLEALERITSDLHALAGDPDVAEALKDLEGAPTSGPPNSGAFDKLADGDEVAAVQKIMMALEHLADTEVDTGLAELVLTQIAASIAAELEQAAIAAADPSAPGDARQLATIAALMSEGWAHLSSENWITAAGSFHEAARRADDLL